MRFRVDGTTYDFRPRLTVAEAMAIQDHAKMGLAAFQDGLARGNPYAIAGLLFVTKRRGGEAVRWADLMDINLFGFEVLPDEDEQGAGEAPDPTSSGGTTPPDATTPTS